MQLHQRKHELVDRSVAIVIVTFEPPERAISYRQQMKLEWPVLCDEKRSLYAAYGMERGHWWNLYGPASWWVYMKLFAKGRRLVKTHGEFDQLGGDVLIDPSGTVRMHYVGSGPADRPAVDSIIDHVGRAAAG